MVQGVGFRPFIFSLARDLGLGGWVRNSSSGVEIEVEGSAASLAKFLERLKRDRPAHAVLSNLQTNWLTPCGDVRFEIHASVQDTPKSAWILPDLATCQACLNEIFDPQNRRYHYPFTNCTHCGPRYSLLTALPYDRPHTTMKSFRMCPACQQEYENPQNRRFHAQPNACPDCGPHLELWDQHGKAIAPESSDFELIVLAAARIRQGEILALKGLGGFHLIVDARNEPAVQRLRERKHRPHKPFAVMYPNLDALGEDCSVSAAEIELLTAAAAPIVLLNRKLGAQSQLAASIAPNQNTLGVMLPYTPLHHLLLAELEIPVVATSGNCSQAPICTDEQIALKDLANIADIFLVHNRPIARPLDDSVVRIIEDRPLLYRRARGYAPILRSQFQDLPCILAVGGHLKNTVAVSVQGQILLSQHLGDLDQPLTFIRFQETITQLLNLYAAKPVAIACDAHPDYASTQFAQTLGQSLAIPVIPIQHHYAHVLAGMADNDLTPPVLGIAWDGTGYGLDGSQWGGEFLAISDTGTDSTGFQRLAHLRTFPLPGGDCAAREPRRAALGLLYEAFGEAAFELEKFLALAAFQPQDLKLLRTMVQKGVNSPKTSSVGRLFDVVASLTGLCQLNSFEGEAAMQLESTLAGIQTADSYPYGLEPSGLAQDPTGILVLDWQPMISAMLADQEPVGVIAAKFHNTLVEMIVAVCHRVGISQVLLTGGCCQNRYLLERAIQRLRREGFVPYWHGQIPPNDGGIAVGQVLGAQRRLQPTQKLPQTQAGDALCV
jgi:hydrogenase maturation protein HypF